MQAERMDKPVGELRHWQNSVRSNDSSPAQSSDKINANSHHYQRQKIINDSLHSVI